MPGGNKKVTYTKTESWKLKAAGLFKYVWPFRYHQALKIKNKSYNVRFTMVQRQNI